MGSQHHTDEPTHYERLMNYLSDSIWFELKARDYKMSKFILKCTGMMWLGIISASHDGEYYVAFFGSDTLKGVARKIKQGIHEDNIAWKIDQYADRS